MKPGLSGGKRCLLGLVAAALLASAALTSALARSQLHLERLRAIRADNPGICKVNTSDVLNRDICDGEGGKFERSYMIREEP
jgi:hypothetical protein